MGKRIGVVMLLGLAVLGWGGRTSPAKACSCVSDDGPHRVFVGTVVEEIDAAPPDEPWAVRERTYRFAVDGDDGREELVQVTAGAESACGVDAAVVGRRYEVMVSREHQQEGRPARVNLCSGSLSPAGELRAGKLLPAAMALGAVGLGAVAFVRRRR